MDARSERDRTAQRNDDLRAGLVAAATYNVHRKPGSAFLQPRDIVGHGDGRSNVPPESDLIEFRERLGAWYGPTLSVRRPRMVEA